nr:transposase [Leptospira kirschneri]
MQYDEEFKKNTVELLIKSRKSMTENSKDLGVPLNTLLNWKKKYLTFRSKTNFKRRINV